MPSTSLAQHRFMQAVAHNPAFARQAGVPPKVGQEFEAADQKSGRFSLGGSPRTTLWGGGGAGVKEPGIFPMADHVASALRLSNHMARQTMGRGHLADGGTYMPPRPGFGEMADYRSILSPTAGGVIASEIPGRTDHIPTSVAADSYVIPADVVSGIGEGNTLAGARFIQDALSTGPHGTPLPRGGSGRNTIPRPPAASGYSERSPNFAKGGSAKTPLKTADLTHDPNEIPVVLAGGEMVIDPRTIAYHPALGGLPANDNNPAHYRRAIAHGHKVLDSWVNLERKRLIKTLKALPGPKR